jgi:hypothetical protein
MQSPSPPDGVRGAFLASVYAALTSNPEKLARTMLTVGAVESDRAVITSGPKM